jgi:hypothetical protein
MRHRACDGNEAPGIAWDIPRDERARPIVAPRLLSILRVSAIAGAYNATWVRRGAGGRLSWRGFRMSSTRRHLMPADLLV